MPTVDEMFARWRANEDEYIAVLSVLVKHYALPIATFNAELGAALFGTLSPLARHASALALALRSAAPQRVDKIDAVIRGSLLANRTYCLGYPIALGKLLEARVALRDVLAQCDRVALPLLPSGARPIAAAAAVPLAALLARPFVRLGAQLVLCERWAACCELGERARIDALATTLAELLDELPDGAYLQQITVGASAVDDDDDGASTTTTPTTTTATTQQANDDNIDVDAEVEQRRNFEEEEQRRKAADDERRRKAADDDERKRRAEEEDKRRKAVDDERRRKLADDERRRKAEDDERRRKVEDDERRRKTEDAERRKKVEDDESRRQRKVDDERVAREAALVDKILAEEDAAQRAAADDDATKKLVTIRVLLLSKLQV